MNTSQLSLRLLYSLIFLFIFTSLNHAQFLTLKKSPLAHPSLEFKFTHPFQNNRGFLNNYDQVIYSGVYDLEISTPASTSINLNIIVPLSIIKYSGLDGDTDIGNIGFGIQSKKQVSDMRKLSFSITLFLPTSPTRFAAANFTSIFINYYDIQKYLPNLVGLYLNSENRWDFSGGHILKIDAGANVLIPTEGNGELEFLLHYGVGGGAAIGDFTALAEFSGIAVLTANIDSFADRLINTFSLGLNYRGYNVTPGIFYKIYFNDLITFSYSGAFGFNIQFDFL